MLYTPNMTTRPVQISMDADLLRQIDSDPEVRDNGRSAFIRNAVRYYLEARRRRELDAAIAHAYDGQAEAMIDEVAELIGMQEWPES